MKLAVQLMATARLVAAPRADWLNSSETRNQGMEPGPIANITTKRMTNRILMYDTHKAAFWNTKWLASVCRNLQKSITVPFILVLCLMTKVISVFTFYIYWHGMVEYLHVGETDGEQNGGAAHASKTNEQQGLATSLLYNDH